MEAGAGAGAGVGVGAESGTQVPPETAMLCGRDCWAIERARDRGTAGGAGE